jgi:peptidoglycan/LPS O-acetylase OafA/YrhL
MAATPVVSVRFVGALLALAIATVHVADQGSIMTLSSPHWLGWGFRLIEAGGVLTALAVVLGRPAWLGWAAGVLLGGGPFIGYILTRSVGLPGDHGDVGNWGYWVGAVSLIIEAALVVLSLSMLLALRQPSGPVHSAAD